MRLRKSAPEPHSPEQRIFNRGPSVQPGDQDAHNDGNNPLQVIEYQDPIARLILLFPETETESDKQKLG